MKPLQKCVRLSEEAVRCIEDYPGDNFSSKLENLVLDIERRKSELAVLDKRVSLKYKEVRALEDRIRGYRTVDARLLPLVNALLGVLGDSE